MTAPPPQNSATVRALQWARRTFELIPTPWLITASGAALLATTAAFGGLADAPEPLPELAVGESYSGADFTFTVQSVQLRDDRGTTLVFPDEEKGERVLLVVVDVVNDFPTARTLSTSDDPSWTVDGIRIDGIDTEGTVTRPDGSAASMLQPDLPTELVIAWVVGPNDFHDGDAVRLALPDATHYVGQSVISGDYWTDVTVGAWVTAEVEEVP